MFRCTLTRINFHNIRNLCTGTQNVNVSRTTVDQPEVDHHKLFAQDWWDEKHGPLKALHAMNDVRIPLIRTGLINTGRLTEAEVSSSSRYLNGIKILDVGCGGGILSIPLSRLGADVTGLDPAPELIEVASREAASRLPPQTNISFLPSSIEEHAPTHPEMYDAVVLSEVIEHVTKKEEFIKHCVRALKPAGSLFVTTINRTIASWLGAIITAEYLLRLLPRGTHDWEKFSTPQELGHYIDAAGCKTVLTSGILYMPGFNKWCWVSDTSISYVLHAVKRIH